jgi:Secretion system C-terminal sorting domain/Metallo-peptidase family M12B Reprolysin-like
MKKKSFTSTLQFNKRWFIILFLVLFSNTFYAQNNNRVFTKINQRPTNISVEMGKKLEKLEKDTNDFKKCHYISVGDIKKLQKNNKLTIHVPSTGKPMTFKAKRVETYSDEDYTWYGEDEVDGYASVSLRNKDGIISGFIKTEDEVSEIYGLSRGVSVVIDKKAVTKEFCRSDETPKKNLTEDMRQIQISTRSLCTGPPKIRVLFVTDDDSRASVPDINQTAQNCIASFNSSLDASGIPNQTARLIFAGMLNLTSFQERLSLPNDDMDLIKTLSANTRDNVNADIVVFLTAFNYVFNGTSVNGIVRQIEADANNAFAIVKANVALNSRFTFSHEIGHLFGGLHRPAPPATDPPGFFALGHCINAGPNFLSKKNYETVMSVTCLVTAIDKFSNPAVTLYGTPTGTATRNVARKISERANTVGDFRTDIGNLTVSISGDPFLQGFQNFTYTATPQCESGNVNFNWEVSSDGFNFFPVLSGIGQSDYSFYYNPYTFTNTVIRVTITDDMGRTAVSFMFLQLDGSFQLLKGNNNNKLPSAIRTKIETTAYPNPANGDDLIIDFNLGEDSKEISIELMNHEGRVVYYNLKKQLTEGSYKENVNIKSIPSGFYVIKTSADGTSVFNKIIISK